MIPISYIRSSSYSTHEMCPMKYFGEYILGWTGLSNRKADKGTIVHKVMEIMANIKLAEQKGNDFFEDEILGKISRDDFDVDKYTELVYNYYSENADHHFWGPADLRECLRWVRKALEFNNGKMNPFNQNIVVPEQHFDIDIKSEWGKYEYQIYNKETEKTEILTGNLKLKGTIDLIIKLNENTHEIIDYKTGMRKNWATGKTKEYDDFYKDFQLRLYHYAHTILFPDVPNVLITIYYINQGGPFTIALGLEDIPETLEMIRHKFEEIKNTEVPKTKYGPPCKYFCHLGKDTFENTNIKALDTKPDSKLSKPDSKMCMCDQLKYTFTKRNMNNIIDNMTKEGHKVDRYRAPGETN